MPVVRSSAGSSFLRTEIQPGIWLDSRRAVWLAAARILVVADLHWGYTASHRARGNLLPWWGDDEIEQHLHALIATYQPAEMIWLGDVVHAAEGGACAENFLRHAPLPVTILAGNHDRRWRRATESAAQRGRFFFHHGHAEIAAPADALELIGHHHPAVSWSDSAGTHVKLPALVASPRRLVLPAFSPWATGTPWIGEADASPPETLWAIAPKRIFAVPRRNGATAPIMR